MVTDEAKSILYWIAKNHIKSETGQNIEFYDHRFMIDIYADRAPIQVIRKASQVGASTMEILKVLHNAIFLGINQIYTLPTADDVYKFVPSKVNQMIRINPCIKERIDDPKNIDSIEQKQIDKAFIYFKGTFTEREAIMLTSDRNIHDEVDRSKSEIIRDYASRMGFSKVRSQHFFSTPTVFDTGIEKLFEQSDQKHWRFNCPHCNYRQHMEWDKNVDIEHKVYTCQKCHQEITPRQISEMGSWEERYPGREISGYWISQMNCPWRTAADLIKEKEKAEDEAYFYNFILGLPYVSSEQRISASLFVRNITEVNAEASEELNVMGVDTGLGSGKGNHVIIGNKDGIFWIGVLTDEPKADRWQQLANLIKFFDVRVVVIDGQPYTQEAFNLAKQFPYRVFLHFFRDDPKMLEVVRFFDEDDSFSKPNNKEFEDEVKVLSSRTRIMDDTIEALTEGKIRFAMSPQSSSLRMLIDHAQTMFARIVTDKFGQAKREWANTGANDLWLALVYWHIALKKRLKFEPNK